MKPVKNFFEKNVKNTFIRLNRGMENSQKSINKKPL
jgi:hypothetical protein